MKMEVPSLTCTFHLHLLPPDSLWSVKAGAEAAVSRVPKIPWRHQTPIGQKQGKQSRDDITQADVIKSGGTCIGTRTMAGHWSGL